MILDDETCWQAVRGRDEAFDGRFVYSVSSTGVFCRPSCPSRTARRENVAFHPDAPAARRSGFRPCLRCRPEATSGPHAAAMAAACRMLEQAEEAPSLRALASQAGLSPWHFHRVFRDATGLTPRGYAAAARARRLQVAMDRPGTMTTAALDAGFNGTARFYAGSEALLGMSPRARRQGGKGEVIHFAVGQCSLGAVLVAAAGRGVCAVQLGDDPTALLRDLEDRFPHADLRGGEAGFEALVARVVAAVEAPGRGLDLPLDVRGTAFQQRVWSALNAIAPGRTESYAALAARLGLPGGARAVAAACAANPLAVLIPCHRVVRMDGGLAGYRWGIERKRVLLEREAGRPSLSTGHGTATSHPASSHLAKPVELERNA